MEAEAKRMSRTWKMYFLLLGAFLAGEIGPCFARFRGDWSVSILAFSVVAFVSALVTER